MANSIQSNLNAVFADFRKFEQLFEKNRKPVLQYAAIPLVNEIQNRAPIGTRTRYRYQRRTGGRAKRGQGVRAATMYPGNLRGSFQVLKHLNRTESVFVGPKRSRAKTLGKGKYDGYYAHMVEFGTSRQRAQPFVQPAIPAAAPQVIRRIELGYKIITDKFK